MGGDPRRVGGDPLRVFNRPDNCGLSSGSGLWSSGARCWSSTTAKPQDRPSFGIRNAAAVAAMDVVCSQTSAMIIAAVSVLVHDSVARHLAGVLRSLEAQRRLDAAAMAIGIGCGDGHSESALARRGDVVGWPDQSPPLEKAY